MDRSLCCRLCETLYPNNKSAKHNIFVTRNSDRTLRERLFQLGLDVPQLDRLSETICRPCWGGIKKMEDSEVIRDRWRCVTDKQYSQYFPPCSSSSSASVKRLLSPASKLITNQEKRARDNRTFLKESFTNKQVKMQIIFQSERTERNKFSLSF